MLIDSELYIYSWILPVCTVYVFRVQKTVAVTTAGVPYSLLLTFPKALSTNVGSSSMPRTGEPTERFQCGLLLLPEFKAASHMHEGWSQWEELRLWISVCLYSIYIARAPPFLTRSLCQELITASSSPACSVATHDLRGALSAALCSLTGENSVKTNGGGVLCACLAPWKAP